MLRVLFRYFIPGKKEKFPLKIKKKTIRSSGVFMLITTTFYLYPKKQANNLNNKTRLQL